MAASFRFIATDCLLVGPALCCLQPCYVHCALPRPQKFSVSVAPPEWDLYFPQRRRRNCPLPIAASLALCWDGEKGLAGSWISVSWHPWHPLQRRKANVTVTDLQGACAWLRGTPWMLENIYAVSVWVALRVRGV